MVVVLGKADDEDFAEIGVEFCKGLDFVEGDGGSLGFGITVDSGADAREGDGVQLILYGKPEAIAVAGGQQEAFALMSPAPDGSDRVDHVSGRQTVAFGDLSFPGITSVEGAAFGKQFRTGSPMDGAVDTSASEQTVVGGIDNSIHFQAGDVSAQDFETVISR